VSSEPASPGGLDADHRVGAPAGIRDAARYAPQLEALRGVAILLVVVFHADGRLRIGDHATQGTWVSPLSAFVHAGHTGVTLFFVLSAFLLSRLFIVEARGGQTVSRGRFLARRALRILPLFWIVVIVSSLLDRSDASLAAKAIPQMLFLHSVPGAVVKMFPYSDVWWSLATEAQFYVVLALSTLLIRTRAGRWAFLALVVVYLGAYFQAVRQPLRTTLSVSLFGRGAAFLIGACASWIYETRGAQIRKALAESRAARLGAADAVLIALLVGLGYLLREVTFMGYFTAERHWHVWHVMEALLWASVVLLTLVAPLRLGVLLSNRVVGTAGLLSYSMYLVHLPVIFFVVYPRSLASPEAYQGWTPTSFGTVLFAIALGFAVSALTYSFIERPVLRRKARIGD
jgi:peptidoglycan/LPS O-acetylase OafA/YrhL